MNNRIVLALSLISRIFLFGFLSISPALAKSSYAAADLTTDQALQLGTSAYIYAYPLITMETTRAVMTNVSASSAMAAPMGQFANVPTFPDASFKTVTAPNADTLYSVAWLDLTNGPYVLHVPDEHGRYYLMPMLDAWTNVFASPGTRTTGTTEQNFVVVGPNWRGKVPSGLTEIKAPTNLVWIIGRTYCSGTPEDYQAVHAIQAQYSLTPLNQYGKSYTPPTSVLTNPNIDMKTSPRDQVNNMDAGVYFNALALLMNDNPPAKTDAHMLATLAKLGIRPGQAFDISKINPSIAQGLQQAVKAGLQKIVANINNVGVNVNGWQILFAGKYDGQYLTRATVTYVGLGANLPQDAIYPKISVDAQGNKLSGTNNYVLHFNKGELPPVNGFWSLTMYDSQYFFVPNNLNRFSLGTKNKFNYNPDGSLDIYIQHQSPGKDKEANWLPAPADNFNLIMRLYWPKAAVLNGTWKLPIVQKV